MNEVTRPDQGDGITSKTDGFIRNEFFKDYDVVARAPTCVFLYGNHSVVYGHFGLYLPVPRYTYVGLKVDSSVPGLALAEEDPLIWVNATESLRSSNDCDFKRKLRRLPGLDEQGERYILQAYDVIRRRYFAPKFQNLGMRMKVFCQAPTRSGMDSSGSIAAALTMALSTFFKSPLDEAELSRARGRRNAENLVADYLRGSESFETLSTLGWFLDDCLHGLGGSAIGSVGSLLGTDNGQPFIFIAEARTGLAGSALRPFEARSVDVARDGRHPKQHRWGLTARRRQAKAPTEDASLGLRGDAQHPFNYKPFAYQPDERLDRMAGLKRLVVRIDDPIARAVSLPAWWSDSGIAVVYGGDPKFTRDMLTKMGTNLGALAGSSFVTEVLRLAAGRHMQFNPLEGWLLQTGQPPEGLDMRAWYALIGSDENPDYGLEWYKQHRKELMMMLMGGTTYLGLEALFSSRRPYEFAEKLRQQQDLFRVLGMSRAPIDILCSKFAEYEDNYRERPFGATITGGGGGGDVVIFGTRDVLEQNFDVIYDSARSEIERRGIQKHESLQVHYRSWQENVAAEPAQVIYSGSA